MYNHNSGALCAFDKTTTLHGTATANRQRGASLGTLSRRDLRQLVADMVD